MPQTGAQKTSTASFCTMVCLPWSVPEMVQQAGRCEFRVPRLSEFLSLFACEPKIVENGFQKLLCSPGRCPRGFPKLATAIPAQRQVTRLIFRRAQAEARCRAKGRGGWGEMETGVLETSPTRGEFFLVVSVPKRVKQKGAAVASREDKT